MTRRLVAIPLALWERDGIKAALVKAKLPAHDLGDARVLVWRFEAIEGTPVGFGGLEIFGRDDDSRGLVLSCGAIAPPGVHRTAGPVSEWPPAAT